MIMLNTKDICLIVSQDHCPHVLGYHHDMSAGTRIEAERTAQGLSQEQLAARVRDHGGKISQTGIDKIEKRGSTRPRALPEIANRSPSAATLAVFRSPLCMSGVSDRGPCCCTVARGDRNSGSITIANATTDQRRVANNNLHGVMQPLPGVPCFAAMSLAASSPKIRQSYDICLDTLKDTCLNASHQRRAL